MKKHPEKIVDFHVHLLPDELFRAIWTYFKKEYGMEVVHRLYAQDCIEHLRKAGVETIVYSNYAHRAGVAEGLNRWNIELLDRTEDIFCFAPYHPDDPHALKDARSIISHPKILGFKLHYMVQEIYPHDERLFPLYEMVQEQDKRLLLHVGTGPLGNKFVGISHLEPVLKRYPGIKLNIAHLGGFEFREFFNLLESYPEIQLDTSYCFLPDSFRMYNLGGELLEAFSDRILYGSDFPNLFHDRQEEIKALLDMDLPQEFYDRIFRENAHALLPGRMT